MCQQSYRRGAGGRRPLVRPFVKGVSLKTVKQIKAKFCEKLAISHISIPFVFVSFCGKYIELPPNFEFAFECVLFFFLSFSLAYGTGLGSKNVKTLLLPHFFSKCIETFVDIFYMYLHIS